MCPNFHCNLTVWFTFNCCSNYSWIIVKLIYSFFYCNFYIELYKAIKCKPYSEIYTVESGTQLKTIYICSVLYSSYCSSHSLIWLIGKTRYAWEFGTNKEAEAVFRLDCSNIISASLVSEQIVVYMYTNTTQ